MNSSADARSLIKPGRRIDAISAVFLPFDDAGKPDLGEFERCLTRTWTSGLQPAVNMDTGFGPQLSPSQRVEILNVTRAVLGAGIPFVAGAMPFGMSSDPLEGYVASVRMIMGAGGTPIVFPSELFADVGSAEIVRLYRDIVAGAPGALGFELGKQFAEFGRIFDDDTFKGLLEIRNLAGLKHSSLSRSWEMDRLATRDRERPDFKVYTGNDLAIDMVMYGSDYLLGLSAFEPEAFALRDRWWADRDDRFYELNDALQVLGTAAFREPVPAYKDSAAVYLKLTGALTDPHPHPDCPRRPPGEAKLLAPFAEQIAALVKGAKS